MPLTRLDNLYSSKTGKYLYVSPDDFNATDELDNRGNSPLRPFKTIQRAFIEVSRYSYLPGSNNDRFDQFSIMLMPGNHYIDNRPGLVTENVVEARYFDAGNLVTANKQEIVDYAVAQVPVNHPDFYYPGDPQTGAWSRYKDAYRMIQLNREEVIDRAVAEVTVDHPDFYFPGDPQTDDGSRYADAYRLIQKNKDLIAQDAFDFMDANNAPSVTPPNYSTACKRDIARMIDGLSLDVFQGGGNVYTRRFISTYFNEAGNDWIGEKKYFTPTDADYNPTTGEIVVTFGQNHSLSVGQKIYIKEGGLSFTCDMDNNDAAKSYPRRGEDPFAVKGFRITGTTANTITFNAGVAGVNKTWTPTFVDYNSTTGDMIMTLGQHGLAAGKHIVIEDNSLTFTCDQDSYATQHTYPRPGTDPYAGKSIEIVSVSKTDHTAIGATYTASTGSLVLEVTNHGFANGDYIKVSDDALGFTCDLDGNTATKTYPRQDYDYPSGRWMEISNVTANTFEINVGPSSYTGNHTFVSCVTNGIQRQTGNILINVGAAGSAVGSQHNFVSATAGAIKYEPLAAHTFVSAVNDAIESDTVGLRGEESSSLTAFSKAIEYMKLAITNNYTSTSAPGTEYQDLTVTPDAATGDNQDTTSCTDVQTYIQNLYSAVESVFNDTDLLTRSGSFQLSNVLPTETFSEIIGPGENKCKRDVGQLVDYISLDVAQAGGNVYTRKLLQNYFDETGNNWVTNGLQGEVTESRTVFTKAVEQMKKAVTNQLHTYKDITITPGDAIYGNSNNPQENLLSGNPAACADVQTLIDNLGAIVDTVISDENLQNLPEESVSDIQNAGEAKCKRDAGIIVDSIIADLKSDGNANIITATKAYFDRFGVPITNGLVGETNESITVFNAIAAHAKLAVSNRLLAKDLTISFGPAYANANTPDITYTGSGNAAVCQDVQATISTLIGILTETIQAGNLDNLAQIKITGVLPSFNYNRALEEWQDNSILDLSNPDNVLHKFNAEAGGAIVPRGCSLIGYDLRRTVVRPLYVPDPADTSQPRTSVFNLTGGCYLWQFTIKDGDLSAQSPLYDAAAGVGKVYYQKGSTALAIPEYSHHKICIMEYADKTDLDNYYDKVGKAFQQFQPTIDDGDLETLVQENRIVGPLSDSRTIDSIKIDDFATFEGSINGTETISNVANADKLRIGFEVTTTDGSVVVPPNTRVTNISGTTVTVSNAISGSGIKSFKGSFGYVCATVTTKIDHGYFEGQYVAILNSGLSDEVNGTFKITEIDQVNPKVFKYEVYGQTAASLSLVSGQTYLSGEVGGVSSNAVVLAEIDSVESASPYVFNCSIRSTWGQCGMWADGSKATGFKSMVVAQYTGVSLQKDDRAYIRYDRFTNTWNQASLTDAFATVPYHTKGDAYWKDDWRNFHIRASDDSFIQCVSVFAVGFFDHFLMESGGDMSITNSNSNFGNTSLHSVGYKGFAFNQDKGGYITDIIPPGTIQSSNVEINQWYTLDVDASNSRTNNTKVYLAGDAVNDPEQRPASSINGFRIGAKSGEELLVNLDRYPSEPTGPSEFSVELEPSGFKTWSVGIETLTPSSANVNNNAQDAANRIEDNKEFIQSEGYQYIINKNPGLLTKAGITISKCERDIGYFVDAVVSDLRLTGNIQSIQAAEAYYIAGELAYVAGELNETIDALDYVKDIMIAAMRNFDFVVRGCEINQNTAIINVPTTQGIVIGMTVEEYTSSDFTGSSLNQGATPITSNIPINTVVKRIISDTQIELGTSGSFLDQGFTQNALGDSPDAVLFFNLPSGQWSNITPTVDPSITPYNEVDGNGDPLPECVGIASTIEGYFEQVFLVLNNGYTALGGTEVDAYNAITNNARFIAAESVYRVANDSTYAGTKLGQGLLASTGETIEDACVDDVETVLNELAWDIKFGGNSRTWDAANLYKTSASVIGEETESIAVFNIARDLAIEAMRQQTITIQGDHGLTQIIDSQVPPDYDQDGNLENPLCAGIANQITTSIALITTGINNGNLGNKTMPVISSVTKVEPTLNAALLASRATLFSLATGTLFGNPNPHDIETGTAVRLVPKAKAGRNPDKRLVRLPKGFDTNTKYYVIAPGRNLYPENFSQNSTVITATEASGTSFTTPSATRGTASGTYRSVIAQPKIDTNQTPEVALASGTGLKFDIVVNADGTIQAITGNTGDSKIVDPGSRYQAGDIVVISDAQLGNSGADDLEIEITAVSTATYPGAFDGQEMNKLMLATSPENAAAGIYMYSPETDSVDPDVEIELQQYVLDGKYDLHKYKCDVVGASEIESSVAHIFDVPAPNTTPQVVFVRVADDIQGSSLPQLSGSSSSISDSTFYYVRYVSNKRFTLHTSAADAESGDRALTFVSNSGLDFYVYANKRTSPLKFDAEYSSAINGSGLWYLNVKDESSIGSANYNRYSILSRFHGGAELVTDYQFKTDPTLDTRYLRVKDPREKEDRVYRLRYVVPSYLETVRDPLNGFVIRTRTDDKRRLVPQKVLLKPVGGNSITTAKFYNPAGATERIGATRAALAGGDSNRPLDPAVLDLLPEQQNLYDPYVAPKQIEFDSKIASTIQSAREVIPDGLTDTFLEVTLFDHTIINETVKNEIFTVASVNNLQGGFLTANSTQSNDNNKIFWDTISGDNPSTGYGWLQAEVNDVDGPAAGYTLVIKNAVGTLQFKPGSTVRFTQGSVSVDLVANPNSFGDVDGLDKSLRTNYLYRVEGSNVYTIAPGDTVTDDEGNSYYVSTIDDQGDFEDTFYIFDIDTLQERIPQQQDGIYYLTCMRGNISPFPTGSGVGDNFKNFKFSQPISQLYPINYKNDPLWFQVDGATGVRDTAILDVPATFSAADNFVHGLVTVNDAKGSETREMVNDMIQNTMLDQYTYTNSVTYTNPNTGISTILDNRIQAQEGNATSGSEDRMIPISGDSQFVTERKMYVELRRPSIARSGNHTFEYLGFGPGNYSTGFPLRQEVVLTDKQDFYAQSKREDGGIVFYTGLNSNGDLYIGNKKVNAITGEETFLESATLIDSEDEDDDIGNLVTTFDSPVTFNNTITVAGKATFAGPLEINVDPPEGDAVRIASNVLGGTEDITLFRGSWPDPTDGDIVLAENTIRAALYKLNARREISTVAGQSYSFRTHYTGGAPSNITPWQNSDRFIASQEVVYNGTADVEFGDMLFKGDSVGLSGSLGWIYTNAYSTFESSVFKIETDGTAKLTITLTAGQTNAGNKIEASTFIRIRNFSNTDVNGTWPVVASGFTPAGNTFQILTDTVFDTGQTFNWSSEASGADILRSSSNWKEFGTIGSESIRTYTEQRGDFRVGINTVARTDHNAVTSANVDAYTEPRANLDVVGTAFISGQTLVTYDLAGNATNRYDDNSMNSDIREALTGADLAAKGFIPQDNALLVGGDSNNLDQPATLRVATKDNVTTPGGTYQSGGRVGINTTLGLTAGAELDRNLVVVGDGRITGNFKIEDDISVDGGDINTTSTTFNLLNANATIVSMFGDGQQINIANNTQGDQSIAFGNSCSNQVVNIGTVADTTLLNIHGGSNNALVDIATVSPEPQNSCQVAIGGAFGNTNSSTLIGTYQTITAGSLQIGQGVADGTGNAILFSKTKKVTLFGDDRTTVVEAFTSANDLTLGSLGGGTTIRNSLGVDASLRVEGNIRLNGGTNAGIIEIIRGRFSTNVVAHDVGSLDVPNIDFYKYQSTGRQIVTSGNALWGGLSDLAGGGQISGFDNINDADPSNLRIPNSYTFVQAQGGTGEGAIFDVLVAFDGTVTLTITSTGSGYTNDDVLTLQDSDIGGGGAPDITLQVNGVNDPGDVYFLPISTPAATDFFIGDLLLLDRGNAATPDAVTPDGGTALTGLRDQAKSEIVRVVGLTNLTNPNDPKGFRLAVQRAQEGTGNFNSGTSSYEGWTDHPGGQYGTVIAKLSKQSAASFITGNDQNLDGNLSESEKGVGITNSTANVRIGVAEFGGTLTELDLLRLGGTEFVGIADIIASDVQTLSVNDGGLPGQEVVMFEVDSTTGNTILGGNLGVGLGYNRLTVNGNSGDTNIAGVLTTEKSWILNGSTIPLADVLSINNGAGVEKFRVDSATGNLLMNGGNINVYGADNNGDYNVQRMELTGAGDFKVWGSFSALGDGLSQFGGDMQIAGDVEIQGGDLTIKEGGTEIFAVDSDGSLNIAGISNYFSTTGALKWEYSADSVIQGVANTNYFLNVSGNTIFKLPEAPQMGDMIRIIDIGGTLTYNQTLIVRAFALVPVQGTTSNTGQSLVNINPGSHTGGELVVQTPNASFGLVYAGTSTSDGNPGAPASKAGWYLIEV